MADLFLQALLNLISEVYGLLGTEEFLVGLIPALHAAVPADWISVNDLGPDPATVRVIANPPFPAHAEREYARLAHENPLVARYQRTLDGRAYRFSDVVTPAQLHATRLYQEFYRPIGLEHQIAFTLPHRRDRLLGIALSRRNRDFTNAERRLLDQVRPVLIQGYRNAIAYDDLRAAATTRTAFEFDRADLAARGLTPREIEVLSRIVLGPSNVEVAAQLGISARTVQKHLERAYRKLGVRNRTEAGGLIGIRGLKRDGRVL